MIGSPFNVTVQRRYRASPETLFRLFTEPAMLSRWFSPTEDITTEVVEHDLREGGTYRIGFRFPSGKTNFVTGRFREIAPPHRLVFTWSWEEPDPHAGFETRVVIDLVPRGGETEVLVRHERFPDQETRSRHEGGWNGTLDRLQKLLRKVQQI